MQPDWFCAQLGAREHYAVPRALHQQRRLAGLLTDAWVPPRSLIGLLPTRVAGRLRERFYPELASARVAAFTASLLLFEVGHRRLRGWDLMMARNRWFEGQVVAALQSAARAAVAGPRPVLFAYSYAALGPLRWAKAQGWVTVLCQIDPGPVEAEIVAREHRRHPELASRWQAPPPAYWTAWRAECELADAIVVNSDWSREGLLGQGIPAGKIHVVPLIYESPGDVGSLPKTYPERFSAARPLRVLFLGQVNLRKGVARVLEAARRLRGEPIQWWLAGPRDFDPPPADLAAPGLRWIGPVRRGEVSRYYERADIFLFPTLSDGFGLTQLEAQARRLPLIVSRNCGAVVRDGTSGFLLPEASPEAIVTVVLECLRHPARLTAMSARSRVAAEFSAGCVASQLLKLNPTEHGI
jgi:glycosyltransferase involved in cell wall biosynthesis